MIGSRSLVALAAAAACGHAAPPVLESTVARREIADAGPTTDADPATIVAWVPRRSLPAAPTLADVLCVDELGRLALDVVPDRAAPTARVIAPAAVDVCAVHGCVRVPVKSLPDGETGIPLTDGATLAYEEDIYRVANGRLLYHLKNPYADPDDSCGVDGFLGGAILADGHDCSGPAAVPWILEAATGRPIAQVVFVPGQVVTASFLAAVHLEDSRWAIAPRAVDGGACLAVVMDVRTGATVERATCDLKKRVPRCR
jgi:hypothetical protein